jgi:hypothetical protein
MGCGWSLTASPGGRWRRRPRLTYLRRHGRREASDQQGQRPDIMENSARAPYRAQALATIGMVDVCRSDRLDLQTNKSWRQKKDPVNRNGRYLRFRNETLRPSLSDSSRDRSEWESGGGAVWLACLARCLQLQRTVLLVQVLNIATVGGRCLDATALGAASYRAART